MKKIIITLTIAVTIIACNKTSLNDQEQNTTTPNPVDDIIQLSSGGTDTKSTVNQGVREEFILGDQIAFFAAYPDADNPTEPKWEEVTSNEQDEIDQVGPYFLNAPAYCIAEAAAPDYAQFNWGESLETSEKTKKTYPKNDKEIYMYGYYPYNTAADTARIVDGVPQLLIGLDARYANLGNVKNLQPDVLWTVAASVGNPTIKRTEPLKPMTFEHALAQVDFKIKRAENSRACFFAEILFTVPKYGEMNITTGEVIPQKAAAEYDETELITYSITRPGQQIAVSDQDTKSVFADGADKYLMVLPLTQQQTQECKLSVRVAYNSSGDGEYKTFDIALDNASALKEIKAGKLNTITLNVLETEIEIFAANITPWEDNVEDSVLDVE